MQANNYPTSAVVSRVSLVLHSTRWRHRNSVDWVQAPKSFRQKAAYTKCEYNRTCFPFAILSRDLPFVTVKTQIRAELQGLEKYKILLPLFIPAPLVPPGAPLPVEDGTIEAPNLEAGDLLMKVLILYIGVWVGDAVLADHDVCIAALLGVSVGLQDTVDGWLLQQAAGALPVLHRSAHKLPLSLELKQ